MCSFPSEERERERERPRNVRAGIRLSQLFLTFSLFGKSFFFFFMSRAALKLNFEWTKKGPNASIAVHFPVFSLDFVWNFQVIYHRIFLYRFFFRSLLHLTSFRSQKKKKNFKHERPTFSFHDPWTVIGAWTAIGDGPVIVDHCVVKSRSKKGAKKSRCGPL